MHEGCRVETVRSGHRVAVAVVPEVVEAGRTAGMQRDTHTEVEAALEAEAVVEQVLQLVVPLVVVAWFEQLEATVPMPPSLPADSVRVAARELPLELEPVPEHMASAPRTMLPRRGLAVVVHMQQLAVVGPSTAEAILQRCCWHTS